MDPQPTTSLSTVARWRDHRLVIAATLLVFVINCLFLAVDPRPMMWDDAWYAETAMRFLDAWAGGGLPAAADFFSRSFEGIKAPLIILLPQPLLLIFGRHDFVFPLSNALCLVVAGAYLAALVRTAAGPIAAAMAVLVFGLMPLTSYVTHTFFVEVLHATVVMMLVYHAVRCEEFTRPGHALAAGLAAGLGMLAKVTFPVFVGGVACVVLFRTARRHGAITTTLAALAAACAGPACSLVGQHYGLRGNESMGFALTVVALGAVLACRKRWAFNLACAAALGMWISLVWYHQNLQTVLEYASSTAVGRLSLDYGAEQHMTWNLIGAFWRDNLNLGCGLLFVFALIVMGIAAGLTRFIRTPSKPDRGNVRALLVIVAAWILPAALVFTLGRNRATRFILPFLPALVVLYALIIDQVLSRARRLAVALCAVHAVAAVVVYLSMAFGGRGLWFGGDHEWRLTGKQLTELGPPSRKRVDLCPILAEAPRLISPDGGDGDLPMVRLLTDSWYVNHNTLRYAVARDRAPLQFGVLYGDTREAALLSADDADLLVYQEGGDKDAYPAFTNRYATAVLAALRNGECPRWRAQEESPVRLNDGSMVRFFCRAPPGDPASQPADRGK